MSYTLDLEIDGEIRSMSLDAIPQSLTLRLWQHGAPTKTLVAERVVL